MSFNGKKVGEIFETKDYHIFKNIAENRVINVPHMKRLVQRMKAKGWLKTSRIVVNEKYEIIDGQHRLAAAEEAGVPIRYTVVRNANPEDMFNLNSCVKPWSPFDHIHKWVQKGDYNYIAFDKFIKEFPQFKVTECSMLCRNNDSPIDRYTFEEGRFIVGNITIAKKWANDITSLKPYFEKYYNKSLFVRAMIKILSKKPEFKFERFFHKVKLRPMDLVPCGTVDQYIEMIEKIYNKFSGGDDKINLRF